MLKSLKSYQTLNLAKPSKKAWLSPEATTHIDANEILDRLLTDIAENEEDIETELYDQLSANRPLCIEIMNESLDAELAYNYMNCELGKGILAGIVLTLLGQRLLQAELERLEDQEEYNEDDNG
jgi:hypothetical protein